VGFSAPDQTSPGTHPASCTIGTESFPGVKRPGRDVDYPPHLVSKGLLRQAEMAQGVPGGLRPRIFLTFRHYKGGRSSAKRIGRLYPGRNPWYSLSEAESISAHSSVGGATEKKSPVTPPGIDPGTVRLVAQLLNHYATPGFPSHLVPRLKKE